MYAETWTSPVHSGAPTVHPDPHVAAALSSWGLTTPDAHAYRMAHRLFPTIHVLRRISERALPHATQFPSAEHGALFRYLVDIGALPETLDLAAEYVRMFGVKTYNRLDRDYLSQMEAIDLDYYRELDLDLTEAFDSRASAIQTVHTFNEHHVPVEYARRLCAAHAWLHPGVAVHLYQAGIPAEDAVTYLGWPAPHAKQFYENGISGTYANAARQSGGTNLTDDTLRAVVLHEAGVPIEYVKAGTRRGMVPPDIIRYYRNGVPVEYMSAMEGD